MKKNLLIIKQSNIFILLLFLALTFTYYGCSKPPRDRVEELVRKAWNNKGAETFLIDKTIYQPYIGTGLSDLVEFKANIEQINIVEKKEAERREGEDREIRMVINVKGTVGTYRYVSLPSLTKANMGQQKFTVNSIYYFKEDKYGEWRMETTGEIASF